MHRTLATITALLLMVWAPAAAAEGKGEKRLANPPGTATSLTGIHAI